MRARDPHRRNVDFRIQWTLTDLGDATVASPETLVSRLWIHLGVDESVDFTADIAVRLADIGAD